MNRLIKVIMCICMLCVVTGCGPSIDASSPEAFEKSIKELMKEMSKEEKEEFGKDLLVVALYHGGEDKALEVMDGMTVRELHAYAEELRGDYRENRANFRPEKQAYNPFAPDELQRERQERLRGRMRGAIQIAEQNELKYAKLRRVEVTNCDFEQTEEHPVGLKPYIRPSIRFNVRNGSNESISGISFRVKLGVLGNAEPLIEKVGAEHFADGELKPGETREVCIMLNRYSDWGKLELRYDYGLRVEPLGVFDKQGTLKWEQDTSEQLCLSVIDEAQQLLVESGRGQSMCKTFELTRAQMVLLAYLALDYNRNDILKLLIEEGVDVNAASAREMSLLAYALKKENKDAAVVLIQSGANVRKPNMTGFSPLSMAARMGDVEILKMLVSRGVDVDVANLNGTTPLVVAVANGNFEAVKYFVDSGAEVRHSTEPLLLYAAYSGKTEILRYLVYCGAELNATAPDGLTALLLVVVKGNEKMLDILLASKGIDLNASKEGITPLLAAILNPRASNNIARRLIETGADVNACDPSVGLSPLGAAVMREDMDLVRLLVKRGANKKHRLKDGTRLSAMAKSRDMKKLLKSLGVR
ncbi:MAG: ankyrin repeat domain-containing protein [Akkermansia sp.]|nr:ankyrin repeat domain-containing protein [Akkermansia sp.]